MSEQENLLRVKQYRVSSEFFTKGYAAGAGPCTCTSRCCSGGVYADIKERDRIIESKEIIKQHMDETQPLDETTWFDPEETEDPDFPSGRAIGTGVHNDKCVFLNKYGHCSVQVASVANGMDRWAIKPLFCILFPVEVSEGVIGFDDMLQEDEPCCTISGQFQIPLFEACRDELIHLVGEDGFAAMQEHYRSLQSISLPVRVA